MSPRGAHIRLGLPPGYTEEEFYSGFSRPRNKELMRVFNDLDFVEQLGSGIARVLSKYPKDVFGFYSNSLKAVIKLNTRTENTTLSYGLNDQKM